MDWVIRLTANHVLILLFAKLLPTSHTRAFEHLGGNFYDKGSLALRSVEADLIYTNERGARVVKL